MDMKIVNGKLLFDDGYSKDFHEFIDGNILTVYLLLPGIDPETLLLQLDGLDLTISAYISHRYRSLFKRLQLSVHGKLSQMVEQKTYQIEFHLGIAKITLVLQ